MKYTRLYIFATLLLLFAGVTVAWTPMGTGMQPQVRDQITELRANPPDPGTWAVFFDDFMEAPQSTVWDTTSVVVDAGSGVAIVDSTQYAGMLKWSLGAATKGILNAMNLQTANVPFRVNGSVKPDSATTTIEFETHLLVKTILQTNIFAGLTIEDEALYSANSYGFLFEKRDNSATLYAKEIKANQAACDSASCGTVASNTWYKLNIVWNGKAARFYVNGVLKATLTTAANQPLGTKVKPTIEIAQGDSLEQIAYVDYIWAKQRR